MAWPPEARVAPTRVARPLPAGTTTAVWVMREWQIGALRVVAAEGKRLAVWTEAAGGSGAFVTRVEGGTLQAETPFEVDGVQYVLQRDRALTVRAVLGGTRHRLFCNGRACDVR